MTAFPKRFAVSFAVDWQNRRSRGTQQSEGTGMATSVLAGGPPGIRTLNQWIKSPLLCR